MIYWDYNATAPLKESVKKKVKEALDLYPGNPSSTHCLGQESRAYIEKVRRKAASVLKVDSSELLFTGSATETNLFSIRGHWLANKKKPAAEQSNKILASRIEHPSVCSNIDFLAETESIEIVEIPRTPKGTVDLQKTKELLQNNKFWLCTLQGASNETGIIQPWNELAKLCCEFKTPFHSDMVQVFGRLPFDLKNSAISTATISFHKSGGIRASSLLFLNQKCNGWVPSLVGGGQERKRWAGTENILSIASIEALLDELQEGIEAYQTRIRNIRDEFEKALKTEIPEVEIVGEDTDRLPNTSFCIFKGVPSDAMLMALDVENICASAGSACSSGLALPSKVLSKLGYSEKEAKCAIRFSLGDSSTLDQIPEVIRVLKKTVKKMAA